MMEALCKTHGLTPFHSFPSGRKRCKHCAAEAVARSRRKVKATLVEEHGGACQQCGYDTYVGALHFHHLDPTTKKFGVAATGVTRSLEAARLEAKKCILLCANCHAEAEAGLILL
jgi:hypothetical protein